MFNLKCKKCGKVHLYNEGDKAECVKCKEYINYSDMATIADIKEQQKEISKNPLNYWNNICEMQQKQTEKGINKYGFILEENISMADIERITYLQEELIDGLMYCEHLKLKLKLKGLEENNEI